MTVIKPNAIAGINSITVASGAALAVHKADGTLIQTIAGTSGVSTFSSVSVGSATTTNDAEKSINIGLGASISQHTDNSLSLGTGGDERLRIDSSGHLLLGTTTKGLTDFGDSFTIADANAGMTLRVAATNQPSHIYFADGTSGDAEYRGYVQYHHNTDELKFGTAAVERLTIDDTGNVNVGTAATIKANGNATFSGIVTATAFKGDGSGLSGVTAVTINSNADNRVITGSDTANTLTGESNININGGILIAGHTASTTTSNGEGPFVQVKGTDSRGGASFMRHSADAAGCGLYIGKSRNATIGSNTVVQADDELGRITFSGDDGTDVNTVAVEIAAHVDGTPGSNDMPGRLTFLTTADGAASPTERMRIDKSGNVTISQGNLIIGTGGYGIDFSAQTASSATGSTASAEILDHYEEGMWTPTMSSGTVGTGADGRYIRIGDFVLIYVLMNQFSDITSSTPIQISGVPFASAGQSTGSFYPRRMTMNGTPAGLCVMGSSSATLLEPQQGSDGNNMGYHPLHSDIQQTAAYMNFSICYRVT